MNDPIKKYIKRNRDAFDHLEPPTEVLQRLKTQLTPVRPVKKNIFQRYPRTTWLIAAALLAGVACTYVLLNHRYDAPHLEKPDLAQRPISKVPTTEIVPVEKSVETQLAPKTEEPQEKTRHVKPQAEPKPLATRLADSTSASIRLAAILEIEQSGRMDDRLRLMLSESMNHDNNTNVRLAALDVLSRHLQDPQVADLLAESLTSQDDPLVQLGIVKIAAQLNHVGIEEALFAVARNPYTFTAVKDEAYAILLHQEKL
ncbi:HEAT repeat domain-containing protein [Parapedobacter pyrenivorans]|uniref:HEAT repeat domain-containing protein n=1 Tax=Parapedobacter pyrenivorans TaxID=1305674 RepID=UPI003342402E